MDLHQDHAKPVYGTIVDDDDGDGVITPAEPIGHIPTGIPTKLPAYFEWPDVIRCALYKINGPSEGELLQPLTESERNLADRIMDFVSPIQIVKGPGYDRRSYGSTKKKKEKKKNKMEQHVLADRTEKKLQEIWDNIFGIGKQEESEIKKENEKREAPITAIPSIVKRRRVLNCHQSSAETKPKTENSTQINIKAAEKEKDEVVKNQSCSFRGRSSSVVVNQDEKANKIIRSRTTREDMSYRKAMKQFSYLWSQRQKEKATSSSSSSLPSSSSSKTTWIRRNVMGKFPSPTNLHNTPSSTSEFRSDGLKRGLGVKVGIQPYKKTSKVEGPHSVVGTKSGIQRSPTRLFLSTEKQAKLIRSTATSSTLTSTNPNLSNSITTRSMPISKTPFLKNSQTKLTKINKF